MMEIFYKVSAPSASTRSPLTPPSVCLFFFFFNFPVLPLRWDKDAQTKVSSIPWHWHTHTHAQPLLSNCCLFIFWTHQKNTKGLNQMCRFLMNEEWGGGGSAQRWKGACLMSVWAFCGRWSVFDFTSALVYMTFVLFFFCFFSRLNRVCRALALAENHSKHLRNSSPCRIILKKQYYKRNKSSTG